MAEKNLASSQPPSENPADEDMDDMEEEVEEVEEVEVEEEVEEEEEEEEEEEGEGEEKTDGEEDENGEKEGEGEVKKGEDKAEGAEKDRNVEGGSPGKIFVGGLSKETTTEMFVKYFEKYGKITDSVIMKDRKTGNPRGFGFITFADTSIVDKVIEENHVINGKQVEIKRTIPKGALSGAKDFKTKKIFVGGIPTSVKEDDFKDFFAKFGDIKEHQIMRDHSTKRSRGFGFITFTSEESVDNLLSKGNRVDFAGVQVEIKKAQPKSANPPPPTKYFGGKKAAFGGGSYGDFYGGYGGGYGAAPYGAGRGYAARPGPYGGYGGGGYEGYDGSGAPPHRDPALAYSGRYGEGGYGRGYGPGGYGKGAEGYGGYYGSGAAGYEGGAGYDPSLRAGYGSASAYGRGGRGGYGGGAAGYGGASRYHPYGR